MGVDFSQSPIFSRDRLDIPRLTVTAILFFKCTEGAGVRNYSSGAGAMSGGGGREKYIKYIIYYIKYNKYFSRFLPNHPRPLSSFDTHARWQPVTQSAQPRWSCGKIEDCEQSSMGRYFFAHSEKLWGINVSRDISAARPKNGKKGYCS